MPRTVALLRAVNVGGRTVKSSQLRSIFESLGLEDVGTFLASGNVLFRARGRSRDRLRARIEAALADGLGYEVVTFLRTADELHEIVEYRAFPAAELRRAAAFNVAFIDGALDRSQRRALGSLTTAVDAFHAHATEVYWLCRKKQSASGFSGVVLERALGVRATLRTMRTVERLVARADDRPGADG